jgi:hypothetical protein
MWSPYLAFSGWKQEVGVNENHRRPGAGSSICSISPHPSFRFKPGRSPILRASTLKGGRTSIRPGGRCEAIG